MRFGINLRGDLAKLDDAELSSEFDRLVGYRIAKIWIRALCWQPSKELSTMARSGHSGAGRSMPGGPYKDLDRLFLDFQRDGEELFTWLSARSRMFRDEMERRIAAGGRRE